MSNVTIRNNGSLVKTAVVLSIIFGTLIPTQNAQATAMKSLADANNQLYRDVRDLGPGAGASQLLKLQRKDFGPALRELDQEHAEMYKGWKKAAKAAYLTKEQFLKLFGYALGSKGPDDPNMKKKPEDVQKSSGRIGAQTGTGEQGGSDGAKDVNLGGKRVDPNAPKVNSDGIIE